MLLQVNISISLLSENKRDAACCHHNPSLSFSLHYTHVPPQATGDVIHTTHTHTCPAYARVLPRGPQPQSRDQRPVGSRPSILRSARCLQCHSVGAFCSPSPSPNSSHTTPAPPSGITGHPWSRAVATCVRLLGGHCMRCSPREVELHAVERWETGACEDRKCENFKKGKVTERSR